MTPDLAALAALAAPAIPQRVEKLHGDGSSRTYWRVATDRGPLILLVGQDGEENAAWLRIGAHLARMGVRVPKVIGANEARGWILMEDIGDVSLMSWVAGGGNARTAYGEVVVLLSRMQTTAAAGFTLSTGFAKEPYGPRTMVEDEGLYFVREFAAGVVGITPDEAALLHDFGRMAEEAAKAPATYFLHRDFQSRNVQRASDGWAVLDFQGARPGPLAYDAAALICDPYAALPKQLRDELWGHYFEILAGIPGIDVEATMRSRPFLGAFRLMQALGAYGKLGGRFGKQGFLEHSGAALTHLRELAGETALKDFRAFNDLVAECADRWAAKA